MDLNYFIAILCDIFYCINDCHVSKKILRTTIIRIFHNKKITCFENIIKTQQSYIDTIEDVTRKNTRRFESKLQRGYYNYDYREDESIEKNIQNLVGKLEGNFARHTSFNYCNIIKINK